MCGKRAGSCGGRVLASMSVKEGAGCVREGAAYGGVSVSLAVVGRKLPLDLLSQVMDSVNQMACNCFISQKPVECFSDFQRIVLG